MRNCTWKRLIGLSKVTKDGVAPGFESRLPASQALLHLVSPTCRGDAKQRPEVFWSWSLEFGGVGRRGALNPCYLIFYIMFWLSTRGSCPAS